MIAPPVTILPLPAPRPVQPLPPGAGAGPLQPPVTTLPLPAGGGKQLQGNGQGPDIAPADVRNGGPIGVTTWGKVDVTYAGNGTSVRTFNLLAPLVPGVKLGEHASFDDALKGAREVFSRGDQRSDFVLSNDGDTWYAAPLTLDQDLRLALTNPTGTGGVHSWRAYDGARGAQALVAGDTVAHFQHDALPYTPPVVEPCYPFGTEPRG